MSTAKEMLNLTLLLTLIIGFSVIAAAVLYVAYAFFLGNLPRSPRALITGALLLIGLSVLQLGHLEYLQSGAAPLDAFLYRFWLFLAPSMFYLFGRSVLFDERTLSATSLLHLTPVLFLFIPQLEIALSLVFCFGTGYSLWLTQLIYSLRSARRRSAFELFFLVLFSLIAVGVLVLGFSLPFLDPGYFYRFYALSIGMAFVLVIGALVSYPELLTD
ncbi:MAG: AraC family transcriptional regulator, partial [Pseudomonadota bacterium]